VLGQVNVNVSGYGQMAAGFGSFYENQTTQSTGAADPGSFTIYVPVASGTGSYTYVDIYDKDYKGISIQLSTTANCTYAAPASTFVGVKDSGGADLVNDHTRDYLQSDFGTFQAGMSNTVTLYGTANRAGHPVTVQNNVCGNRITKSTNASLTSNVAGSFDWSVTMDVYGTYNNGDNYYNVTDASNNRYVYVKSTNTVATPPPPFQAYASPGSMTGESCTYREYDLSSLGALATSVTITGTTTAPDGTGHYQDPLNGNYPFTIVNGSFTIPGIALYSGWNNLYLSDTNYNSFQLSILTANNVPKPQFVMTTSPGNNDPVSGLTPVIGTISVPTGFVFLPDTVYASVYDGTTGAYKDYSSDLYMQQQYGYGAILFDGTNYSFDYDFGTPTNYSSINVYAYDNINGVSHGHQIYVNTGSTWGDYYYKPGAKPAITPAMFKKQIELQERMQHELKFRKLSQ